MITASKMDAANVEALLKRDVELVAANETLARLVDWDGLGVGESKARKLYERTAAEAEEHASAERELRADLEARGACLQAEIAKLSQAQTALDYAGVRRAELERELETAHSDMDNMKAQLYTLRGLQKAWNEREKTLCEMLGCRATDLREGVLRVGGLIGALDECRLFLLAIVDDESVGADADLRTRAAKVLRVVLDQAIEPRSRSTGRGGGRMTDQSAKCRACTACCRAPALSTTNCHAPFTSEELDAMKATNPWLRSAVIGHCDADADAPPGQPCQFLDTDTGRCLIYDDRPRQCRDFVVDGPVCVAAIGTLGVSNG